MPIKKNNPHTVSVPGANVSYWRKRDGTTISSGIAEATEATLIGIGGWPELSFAIPAEEHTLKNCIKLLHMAFRWGRMDMQKEIRQVLQVPSFDDLHK